MEEFSFNFENLIVYQKAKGYVKLVYCLLRKFPKNEEYALCDQLRRASISVTSNIAEGMSRQTAKDRMHFLDIAYGSLMETFSQMDLAYEFGYITSEEMNIIREQSHEVFRILSGLKKSLKTHDSYLTTKIE